MGDGYIVIRSITDEEVEKVLQIHDKENKDVLDIMDEMGIIKLTGERQKYESKITNKSSM